MNCPYCSKEMASGFLKSSHFIYWGEDKSLGFLPNDLKLTKFNFESMLNRNFVESHYCSNCNKIIVSLGDK